MNPTRLHELLDSVATGALSPDDAARELRHLPFADLGDAKVDHHRWLRQGMPEAVYAPSKTPEQCSAIVCALIDSGVPVVLSRANQAQLEACPADASVTVTGSGLSTAVWNRAPDRGERIVVVTAGTADLPVAHECGATLAAFGVTPLLLRDCGVAGIHRLTAHLDDLATADAVVAIAGMEGALASVVGGLSACPVIAVPTSVGYGSSFEGITALLAMLSSCAAGVTVVGIDNGYGAASAVMRLLGPVAPGSEATH